MTVRMRSNDDFVIRDAGAQPRQDRKVTPNQTLVYISSILNGFQSNVRPRLIETWSAGNIERAMRMLLVEDEKKVSELVARALRAERYAVDVAGED